MSRGTIVITGATGTILHQYALQMAKVWPEAHQILFCRNPASASPGRLPPQDDKVSYRQLDMTHLDDVRQASQQVAAEVSSGTLPPIAALVLAAGVNYPDVDHVTPDGYEETMQVSHLANYLVMRELLGSVARDGRILIMGSHRHHANENDKYSNYRPRFESLDVWVHPVKAQDVSAEVLGQQAYINAKLAQMMTGNELARRLAARSSEISVSLYDPGTVLSGLIRHLPGEKRAQVTQLMSSAENLKKISPDLVLVQPTEAGKVLQRLTTESLGDQSAFKAMEPQHDGAIYVGPHQTQIPTMGDTNDRAKCAALWDQTAKLLSLTANL